MKGKNLDLAMRLRRLKSGQHRTKTLGSRLSEGEEAELLAAAELAGRNLSEWSREVLLREARRPIVDPVFTEIIAMRLLLNNILRLLACGEVITQENFSAVLAKLRETKHAAAIEVMQQYKPAATEGN